MKEVIKFSRGVGMMVLAGIHMVKACRIYASGCRRKRFKRVIERLILHIEGGGEISEGLRREGKIFPPIFIGMIRIGEATGNLGETLTRASQLLEKEQITRRNFKRALLYPKILLVVTSGAIGVLLIWMVPMFVSLVDDRRKLPLFTKWILEMSEFFKNSWYLMLGGVFFLIISFKVAIKNRDVKNLVDRYRLKIPFVGNLEKIRFNIRFGSLLSILLNSGVVLSEAISLILENEDNREIYRRIMRMKRGLERGKDFAYLIDQSHLFSELDISLIKVGEESGELGKVLEKMAEIKKDEMEERIKILLILAEPMIILFMGIIMGGLVAGVYLPILDMIEKNI